MYKVVEKMGAKASTANGGHQSPRTRTFSTSSSSDVVSTGTGFNLLRAIPGMHVFNDRQRARSLSSVPDLQTANHESISIPPNGGGGGVGGGSAAYHHHDSTGQSDAGGANLADDNAATAAANAAAAAGALALGRVYTATSLPSHIWSLNGT